MKIVLDTNVLISGFKDEYSYEKRIIDAVLKGQLQAFANRSTLRENKLIASKLISSDQYRTELNNLFAQIKPVDNRRQVHVVSDPDDNKILESAVEAEADFLITSDNELLRLVRYKGVSIVSPAEFWVKYQDDGENLWQQWADYISKQSS